jgi:hypothetical protein
MKVLVVASRAAGTVRCGFVVESTWRAEVAEVAAVHGAGGCVGRALGAHRRRLVECVAGDELESGGAALEQRWVVGDLVNIVHGFGV